MPLDDGGRKYIFIVLGLVAGGGLAFSLNWVGKRSQAKKETGSQAAQPQANPSPDTSLLFKKEEDAIAALGEPDIRYQRDDRLSLIYSRPAPNRPDEGCPDVQIMNGEIRFIINYPCDTMPDRIATAKLNNGVEPKPIENRSQHMTFEQAFAAVKVGAGQDSLLRVLGEPDDKRISQGREIWQYDTLIVENGAARKLAVVFDDSGRVAETQGM